VIIVRLRPLWMTNHFPSVLWHCWLGHQTCKNRWPYNLYCVSADVKPCSINKCRIPLSVCLSVCNICIVAKQCVLPKICLKKQMGNGLYGLIDWLSDWLTAWLIGVPGARITSLLEEHRCIKVVDSSLMISLLSYLQHKMSSFLWCTVYIVISVWDFIVCFLWCVWT